MNDKYASITEGLEENLRGNKEAGTFSITTDLRNVYYNFTTEERIKLGTGKNLPNGAEIFNDYINCQATGKYAHAENSSVATGDYSHSEGHNTIASGNCSHSEGDYSQALGDWSHAEGYSTKAVAKYSHTQNFYCNASGTASSAEDIVLKF